MQGIRQIIPEQHAGKQDQNITSIIIIQAEIWETRRISGDLILRFRKSSPMTVMVGRAQTTELPADREVVLRDRKIKCGTL